MFCEIGLKSSLSKSERKFEKITKLIAGEPASTL
jgi:hypothetical protein